MSVEEQNKALVRRFVEAYAKSDLQTLDELLAPGYVDHSPFPGQGIATFQTASLDQADLGDARFDKIFVINVGLFWRQRPVRELKILRGHLATKGQLFLFHEPPPGSTAPPIAASVPAVLESGGFAVTEILTQDLGRTRVGCVVAGDGLP